MSNIEFDSALMPPEAPDIPEIPVLSLADQKVFLLQQVEDVNQTYAVKIARGQATMEDLEEQKRGLLAVLKTLDDADNGIDIRRSYSIRKPVVEIAPRPTFRKASKQIEAPPPPHDLV
jgi:hypothetical protein